MKDISAHIGHFNISDETEKHWIKRSFSQKIIHDSYGSESVGDSNIAIIILDEAVEFTKYIQPIQIPLDGKNSYNLEGTIVGYGRGFSIQGTPHHAKVKSISPIECVKTNEDAVDMVSLENSFCAKSDTSMPCVGK